MIRPELPVASNAVRSATEKLPMHSSSCFLPPFLVGIRQIDDEHREILNLCERAVRCPPIASPGAQSEFHFVLNELAELLGEHFRHEESMLQRNRCPSLEQHQAEHFFYLERLSDLLYSAAEGVADSRSLQSFASDYLTRHLLGTDRSASSCLKS